MIALASARYVRIDFGTGLGILLHRRLRRILVRHPLCGDVFDLRNFTLIAIGLTLPFRIKHKKLKNEIVFCFLS